MGSRSRVEDVPDVETRAHGCAGDEPHFATRAEAVKGIVFKLVIFPVLSLCGVDQAITVKVTIFNVTRLYNRFVSWYRTLINFVLAYEQSF